MSDEEVSVEGVSSSDQQYLTAEYKDGRLQIVEVTPFERNKDMSILPDDGGTKFLMGRDENGLVQLDLLNLTLVKCDDGEESYRLVTSAEAGEGGDLSDTTVTCVLQTSDGEDGDGHEYVMVESAEDGTLPMYFGACTSGGSQSETTTVATTTTAAAQPSQPAAPSPPKKLTPAELIQRTKAMKKARAIMSSVQPVRHGKRGRRAKGSGDIPMAHQLLSSPQFKLYLYSCKMCSFKCNAVKQLQAHRAEAHSVGVGKGRRGAPPGGGTQYRAAGFQESNDEEPKYVFTDESVTITGRVSLDSKEVEEADVLVCGACGFESGCRETFREHIQDAHGATAT